MPWSIWVSIPQTSHASTTQQTRALIAALGVVVFIQRVAFHWDTKRLRSRSFISMLLDRYGTPAEAPAASSSLIVQ